MPAKPKEPRPKAIRPRIRVHCGGDIAIGPGKGELLDHLHATGSISEAAKRMGMSYMRAWTLIKTMNGCFNEPLVQTARGGTAGGGAMLTETGQKVLELYHRMEGESLKAVQSSWKEMMAYLAD